MAFRLEFQTPLHLSVLQLGSPLKFLIRLNWSRFGYMWRESLILSDTSWAYGQWGLSWVRRWMWIFSVFAVEG
jgi:hypothetical protein